MGAWTELTLAKVVEATPTDLVAPFRSWVDANPGKVSRLPELTALYIETFRQAAGANPACVVDPDPKTVPTVAYHHVLNLIYATLSMEMGIDLAPEVGNLVTQANIWLRMAPTSHVDMTGSAVGRGSPSYVRPCWVRRGL